MEQLRVSTLDKLCCKELSSSAKRVHKKPVCSLELVPYKSKCRLIRSWVWL